jgi:hypothetical protein
MDKQLKVTKVSTYNTAARNPNSRGPKRPYAPTVVYVETAGETIAQNLAERRQRPNTTYKKTILAYGLEKLNIPVDLKLAWNRKAGCSCGCSPGFFLVSDDGYRVTLFDAAGPININVTVEEVATPEAPAQDTTPQV